MSDKINAAWRADMQSAAVTPRIMNVTSNAVSANVSSPSCQATNADQHAFDGEAVLVCMLVQH
jgi:hypothetical protein